MKAQSTKQILAALEEDLRSIADESHKTAMEAYMRHQFTFLGIKMPVRKATTAPYIKELLKAPDADLDKTIKWFWSKPEREFVYTGLVYCQKAHKIWIPDSVKLFEYMITTHSWWDSVDVIAVHLIGDLLRKFPEIKEDTISRYRSSDNMWLNRTAILHQLKYKKATDEALLFDICLQFKGSNEFFIQKAIGWALREHAYLNPTSVKHFVEDSDLKPLSRREALKHFA
jgi:3-methyladenine DNA glycosylase AlkD